MSNQPVSSAVKTLSMREVVIPDRSNWAQCRQGLATAATFLLSCVAQVLSRGDGPSLVTRLGVPNTKNNLI